MKKRRLTEKQRAVLELLNNAGEWHRGFGSVIAEQFHAADLRRLDRRTVRSLIDRGMVKIVTEAPLAASGKLALTGLGREALNA